MPIVRCKIFSDEMFIATLPKSPQIMCRKPDLANQTQLLTTKERKQIHQFLRVARILFVKYLRYAAYGRVHKRCKRVHRCCYASIKWLLSFYNWHKSCPLAWKSSIKKQNVLKNFVTKLVKLMTYQLALGLDERPVGAIHFVVKSTGIAQIMAVAISSP